MSNQTSNRKPTFAALVTELQTAPKKEVQTAYTQDNAVISRASTFDAFGRTGFRKDAGFDDAANLHADARKQGGLLCTAIARSLKGQSLSPAQQRQLAGVPVAKCQEFLAAQNLKPNNGNIAMWLRSL